MSRVTTVKRQALRRPSVRRARAGRELVRLVRVLSRSVLFDRELYEAQRGRRFSTRATAAYDWVVEGSRLGLVAGPLLIAPVPAEGRRAGVGPASWWASQLRAAGFPRTTALPLADPRWYTEQHPGSDMWRGGPLAHYTERGRREGARLGPDDPGGIDVVELGRAAVLGRDLASTTAPASAAPPVPGADGREGLSVLVVAADSWRTALSALPPLLDAASEVTEILVETSAHPTPEARLVWATSTVMAARVRVLPTADSPALALDEAVAAATGSALLVVTRPMTLTPDDVRHLAHAVTDAGSQVDVAMPIVLAADDTVHSAGFLTDDPAETPALRGYPWADAARAGDRPVRGVTGELCVVRRSAVLAAGGFGATDAPLSAADQVTALSRRVAERGGLVQLVVSATASLPRAVGDVPPGTTGSSHGRQSVTAPPYADRAPDVLRWAIKSPHPAGLRRRVWGDYHFGLALAAALERLGHQVAVDPLDSWYRPTAVEDHITLTLRGLSRYEPSPRQVNLLWVISHPELVDAEELAQYDAVFAASRTWARQHSTAGRQVQPLLQCTDASLFRPEVAEPGTGYPLLFVGNSRSARRPLVEAAVESGLDLAVIGGGWTGRVPPHVVRAEFAPNTTLPALYRAAGVVLNDHWPDMARDGFLSNRLFDLTAAGARWISDPATDLTDVFPTGRVASDAAGIRKLMEAGPDGWPTEEELLAASEQVRAEHSFDARAQELSRVATALLESHGRSTSGPARPKPAGPTS